LKNKLIKFLHYLKARVNQEMSLRYRNLSGTSSGPASVTGGASASFDATASGIGSVMSADGQPLGASAFSSPSGATRPVSMEDLNEISRTTLLLMVEWAKGMQPFPQLSMEDKVLICILYK
jgi:hypothetical protein